MRKTVCKLTSKEISFLMRLYNEQSLGIDKLPYTPEFDNIVFQFHQVFGVENGHRELWHTLINLRKQKKLLRKTRSR
jgi:hypothetical protein